MILTADLRQRLEQLTALFLAENQNINLSAFRTHEQCWIGNVLDSLALVDVLPAILGNDWATRQMTVLDLGTGGGFPLLPLAIALPNAQCTGLDATLKKVDAVDRIIRAMDIRNVKVISGRAEEYGQMKTFRGQFDIVLSRAVAPINTLLELCIPFARTKGHVVLWKSVHIAEELRSSAQATQLLSTSLVQSYSYTLPGDWGERQLLVYTKNAATDPHYPRKTGVPKSKPL